MKYKFTIVGEVEYDNEYFVEDATNDQMKEAVIQDLKNTIEGYTDGQPGESLNITVTEA